MSLFRLSGSLVALAAALLLASAMFGCNGGGDDGGADGGGGKVPGQAARKGGRPGADDQSGRPFDRMENGRRFIGDVPLDVFFNDPLQVAADRSSTGNGSVAQNPGDTRGAPNSDPAPPKPETGGTGGKIDWKSLIAAEVLKSEVKSIRNRLTATLQNVGKFNTGFRELPADAATLAVLAAVVIDYPDETSWKPRAKYVRDLAALMVVEELMRGKKSFDTVRVPWEKIIELLDGAEPAELPESADAAAFAESADFGNLMKRVGRGFRWIKTNANNEQTYQENLDKVLHEMSILAVLMQVLTTEGFGYEDDDDFLAHARQMLEACRKAHAAAKSNRFAEYEIAISKIDQKCTQCHMEFRTN